MKEKFKRFIAVFLVLAITLSVQELQVFAETVSKNEVIEEYSNNGQSAEPTKQKTVSGEDVEDPKDGQDSPEIDVDGQEISHVGTNEKKIPSAPIHHCALDYTDFSYVYFGSYPQSEVTDSIIIAAIENTINEAKVESNADVGVDVLVDGIKYRRISKSDTNHSNFFGDSEYRYFKWEKIRWKVLQNDGNTLFVVVDKAIDCKDYNEEYTSITWEDSTIRSWLNGSFYHTAFDSGEQEAVVEQTVVNDDNPTYGTEGGNDTRDKVYLLSIDEVTKETYGFCSDSYTYSQSRMIKASDYAYAIGTYRDGCNDDCCWWWLRSPGGDSDYIAGVDSEGDVERGGSGVNNYGDGICPALHINLQSDLWIMADDGEGEDENNSRVQTPQASISGGAYTTSKKITLASATKGAEIYYTLNGTVPTTSSIKYTAPITITSSVVLKAIAIKNGCEDSQIMTEIYTINIPQNPSSFPANPIHNCNAEDGTQDTTTWSYIYFGSYPKSNVTDSATIAAIDAAIATSGMLADTGVDVWVDGTKYRRISRDETISNGIDTDYNEYFDDVPNNGYRYFKWERIKWKVLKNDGNTLFVAADEIMDCKDYSDRHVEGVTWETSSIRDWLNDGFYNTAFSRNEQSAIQVQTVVNEDVPEYDIQGGNDTKDKVYLLSISEVINQEYGFCSIYDSPSMSRRVKASDYADARGAHNYNGTFLWWLRSNGPANRYHASEVDDEGRLPRIGPGVQYIIDGICPALHINLSSGLWLTEDDGTSGEGGSYGKNILMGLQASKKKTKYMQGENLNLDDLTVTAVYENSSKILPADTYTTNVAAIDMNTPGSKTLNISYTEGTITKTASITITVIPKADTAQQAKKGTKITDKASAGTYKVTSADSEAPTVEYTAPTSTKKKTITIPKYVTYQGVKYKVTSVSTKSFKGNKKLTTIKIASSITKIGDSAFEGCTSLKTVTIGTGLKTIGKNAFKNCKKLKTLTIKSGKLKTVGKNALKGINAKCKIKVPAKKVKTYTKLMKKKGTKIYSKNYKIIY